MCRDCCLPVAKGWTKGSAKGWAKGPRRVDEAAGGDERGATEPPVDVGLAPRRSASVPTAAPAESVMPAEASAGWAMAESSGCAARLVANLAAAWRRGLAGHLNGRRREHRPPTRDGARHQRRRLVTRIGRPPRHRTRRRRRNRRPPKERIAHGSLALAAGRRQSHQD